MKNSEQPITPMPHENRDGTIQHDVYFGLTKREYFSGLAMQGYLSIHSNFGSHNRVGGKEFDAQMAAECAVAYADALLIELEKPQQP